MWCAIPENADQTESIRAESLPEWLASHVRAQEHYGAAAIFVPDNPKGSLIDVGFVSGQNGRAAARAVRSTQFPSREHGGSAPIDARCPLTHGSIAH
jgi:hypothetical protein